MTTQKCSPHKATSETRTKLMPTLQEMVFNFINITMFTPEHDLIFLKQGENNTNYEIKTLHEPKKGDWLYEKCLQAWF